MHESTIVYLGSINIVVKNFEDGLGPFAIVVCLNISIEKGMTLHFVIGLEPRVQSIKEILSDF